MAVTPRIVALAIELAFSASERVAACRRCAALNGTRIPRKTPVIPGFRKEIVPLMQTNTMQRQHRFHAFVEVCGQAFRRNRPIL